MSTSTPTTGESDTGRRQESRQTDTTPGPTSAEEITEHTEHEDDGDGVTAGRILDGVAKTIDKLMEDLNVTSEAHMWPTTQIARYLHSNLEVQQDKDYTREWLRRTVETKLEKRVGPERTRREMATRTERDEHEEGGEEGGEC